MGGGPTVRAPRRYAGFVAASAIVAVACAWRWWGPPAWGPLPLLLALGVAVGEVRAVRLPAGEAVSTGGVMGLAAVWLTAPAGAALVEMTGWLLAAAYLRRLNRAALFNAAQTSLAVLAAAAVFHLLGGTHGVALGRQPLPALILAAFAFVVVNGGLVGGMVALQRGERLLPAMAAVYRSHFNRSLLFSGVSIPVAAGVAAYGWPVLAGYVILAGLLERILVRTRQQELNLVEQELAGLLNSPRLESRAAERLVRTVEAFGRYLELPEHELRDLRFAALLHGTQADRAAPRGLRRAMAMAGINRILAGYRFLQEHGLPRDRASLEAVPRGARILAILDTFHALTGGTGRGAPIGLRAALRILEEQRGRLLDPELTDAFIGFVLEHEPAMRRMLDGGGEPAPDGRLRQLADALRAILSDGGQAPQPAPPTGAALFRARFIDAGLALRLNLLLSEALTVGQAYERIADILAQAVGEPCWVASYSGWGVFRLEAGRGTRPPGRELVEGQPGPMLRAVTRLDSVTAPVDASDSPWCHVLPPGRWTVHAVPLVARGQVIGVLGAARPLHEPFMPGEPELVEAVAGAGALALDNARLRDELRGKLTEVSSLKRFTEQVLDVLPVAVVAFGADGELRLMNNTARSVLATLGLNPARLERLPLKAWTRLDRRWAHMERALTRKEVWHDGALTLDAPCGTRVFDVQVTPVCALNGTVVAAVGTARDITERHRLERQVREAERLAAVGQLAAGTAHEIRNPLTAIKGFIQLMRAELPEEYENLDVVLSEIERIERLVDDLLLMAKPAPVQTAPCSLNRLVEKVAVLLEAQARPHGITIETHLDPGLPEIEGDSRRLRQVLFNLGRNAIEAMGRGGILRFETLSEGVDGVPVVTVRVSDTGRGIPEADRERIFEPFFTTKAGGTGLGLAVVSAIVSSHRGTIDVASAEGRGTVVTVRLPLDGPREGGTRVQAALLPPQTPEVTTS